MYYLLAQGGSGGGVAGFLPIFLLVAIFYFLIYRPMRKRQKNVEEMISSLKNGDRVITSGESLVRSQDCVRTAFC